jgi:hypothetical protein
MQEKRSVLTDCLLSVPWCIHLGFIYTTRLQSLYNSSNQLLSLYNLTSWLQRLYLANLIYLNSSLTSTWAPTWLGLQSWTLSWLNFLLNSVFKLHWIIWSIPWLRLHDLNQHELLIFILLGLDLNRVLYLEILLGSNSFRSPPSTRTNPLYLIWIQLYLLVESVLYKLDAHVYKKVSYRKQLSLLVLHVFVLPGLLTRVFTLLGNSLPNFLPRRLPIFFPEIVPDSLPESLPGTIPESPPESYASVLPGALPESYSNTYPIGLTRPYLSAYLAG